jgi:hypothetical protein
MVGSRAATPVSALRPVRDSLNQTLITTDEKDPMFWLLVPPFSVPRTPSRPSLICGHRSMVLLTRLPRGRRRRMLSRMSDRCQVDSHRVPCRSRMYPYCHSILQQVYMLLGVLYELAGPREKAGHTFGYARSSRLSITYGIGVIFNNSILPLH